VNDSTFKPFESLLNRGIRESTSATSLCERLDGRSLKICVDHVGVNILLEADDGQLRVSGGTDEAADATLTGSPPGLLRLLDTAPEAAIRDGSVRIDGDADVATDFSELLRFARPDIEEELSRIVGDPVARQLGNLARGVSAWAARARHTTARSLADYLQEESRDLPAPAEVAEFCQQVDDIANDVERAQLRLRKLIAQRSASQATAH
jgi:ubiquinone biosynthesis protein UbiJ